MEVIMRKLIYAAIAVIGVSGVCEGMYKNSQYSYYTRSKALANVPDIGKSPSLFYSNYKYRPILKKIEKEKIVDIKKNTVKKEIVDGESSMRKVDISVSPYLMETVNQEMYDIIEKMYSKLNGFSSSEDEYGYGSPADQLRSLCSFYTADSLSKCSNFSMLKDLLLNNFYPECEQIAQKNLFFKSLLSIK
jgi:hypothetical protein